MNVCTLRSEYSLREIICNLLMVEPLKDWASWPSSSSQLQDVTDGNSLGTRGWCWCSSNRVSFKHIRVNSSIRQGLLNPSGNWCWCITGLWGFLKKITSWEPFTRSWAVFSTYTSKVFTGQRESALLNALKRTSLGGPEQRVFIRPGMTNLTPSSVDCLNLMSRARMSEALLALHRASKVTNFLESSFNVNSEVGCPVWKCCTTKIHPLPDGIWVQGGVH